MPYKPCLIQSTNRHHTLRIVIVSDSLAMPRKPEICFEDTYGYLVGKILRNHFKGCEVFSSSRRSNNIANYSDETTLDDDIFLYEPDIVVIQLGIVECAPRLFSPRQKKILRRIKPAALRDKIISIFSKRRRFFTEYFPKTDVPLETFSHLYDELVVKILEKGINVILVNIANTNEENKARSHNYAKNIDAYNAVIKNLASKHGLRLVDSFALSNELPRYTLPDGVHLSVEGNRLLAEKISKAIIGSTKKVKQPQTDPNARHRRAGF